MRSRTQIAILLLFCVLFIPLQGSDAGFSFKRDIGGFVKKLGKAAEKTIDNTFSVVRNPEKIIKKPSSVLNPLKPIYEVIGLQKPIDELEEETEYLIGSGHSN